MMVLDRQQVVGHGRRVCLVTGSGSGIGAATVRALADENTSIVIHVLSNVAGCERVAATARAKGADVEILLGDLADPTFGHDLIDHTIRRFGALDVLVANAGFPVSAHLGELSRADLDRTFAVIAGGFFEMATTALDHLASSPCGRVIAVSTHNAHVFRADYPFYPASAAAKAALEALTRTLALQLAPSGGTANCVAPGVIAKPDTLEELTEAELADFAAKIPLQRIGEPEEVAALIDFLASGSASYITGQVMHVNGGLI